MLDLTTSFHKNMPQSGVYLKQEGNRQIMINRQDGSIRMEATHKGGLSPVLSAAFDKDHSIKEPLFFDGGHPDKEGFILFAAEVENFLRDLNWLE